VQNQWDNNPVGSHHARASQPHTLEWFVEVERHRYEVYAPWMPGTMEFAAHAGHDVLEIGGGMGTDLAQFATHGAAVTDLDLSAGYLQLAEENFRLRGLQGRFIHYDARRLPFDDASPTSSTATAYSSTPNTSAVVREIRRVLRPGGALILILRRRGLPAPLAEPRLGIGRQAGTAAARVDGRDHVEVGRTDGQRRAPLVKVYTKPRLRALFKDFAAVEILQRQLLAEELPPVLRWTLSASERWLGWNLIIKATRN
jgi:SAM-dependent methyltransferase